MTTDVINNRKLKILAYVHGYFPNHNAGSEAMLHQILVDLRSKGHEVRVMTRKPGAQDYEGVEIREFGNSSENEWILWSDVIFTHLDDTRSAIAKAKKFYKPIVFLVHNNFKLYYNNNNVIRSANLIIANSEWIRKTLNVPNPVTIVYPPTISNRYQVKETGNSITLINMNENKGGKLFWQLARLLPDYKFIGVKGAYGKQVRYEKDLPNVTILENTPEIQKVYEQTKIILMPSSYESWGRVGIEAGCSGIPTIAAPTPGLKESLSYSGIFADLDNIADWADAIRMLDNNENYKKYSNLSKKRSDEVTDEFYLQMHELEQKLIKVVTKYESGLML
jgi:glycosyltransferase involved in cell wall biosynthesis